MSTDLGRFLVVPQEWVGGEGYADQEEALGAAALRTRADRKHRAVVRVIAQVEPDPAPAVVVTRFGAEAGDGEVRS
ncbi:hypothetical protein [Stenotrophomonas sp. MMGLT7]|uniref:hypothetical protein n=1 Tax=Stenotrophomonas sp. MMGLT7 TaxID=2901227 RepID=UPI001E397225|nr:hypothetical protein [Stenotrophomonas sp. MMGLT7]MCD7099082.1 hypothetical protein [Stenotrophomonas sp. MMGLT7]